MATADSISQLSIAPARSGQALMALLPPLAADQLESTVARLASVFPPEDLLIATQNGISSESYPSLHIVEAPATKAAWSLTARDYVNAWELAQKHDARAILMLGPEAGSLTPAALRGLAVSVVNGYSDLTLPRYQVPPNAGLINSAILYPLTRALFASRARYPLAIDLGLSLRMAERLAVSGQRFMGPAQDDALLWPISESVVAGYTIGEFDVGPRALPQPPDPDIRTILAVVTGSLFSDIETKAAFWQRPRRLPPPRAPLPHQPVESASDVASMVEAFRLAYNNLHEIWSLVLPPHSLIGLKRLFVLEPASFRMPENLWARIVYDFLIAYRLRTINRGHLLGALIPLYLAWVAGHINVISSGGDPEAHVEAVAAAFDADKPYLVSRWRWPDRFNP